MEAGRLRNRVTLQKRTKTKNSLGEEVLDWVDFAVVWAEVTPIRGQEYFAAGQLQRSADIRLRIRARNDIDEDLRAIVPLNGQQRPCDVEAVLPGSGPYMGMLELMVVSGVRNGR